ncbi:uncharacterized protein LOC143297634 [Babylonia areolata]|uniref:uncharacterized protein LOC143297634 n=1 Tax=Babylonia areolata TaxID=304850 RepID=UPI003FD41A6D
MRVYQPLCPDVTFRLAADLSPDDSEDSTVSSSSSSSSSSAEEEEEAKLRAFDDNKVSSSSAPASLPPSGACPCPVPSKTARDIYNQGHVPDNQGNSVTCTNTSPSATSSPSPVPPRTAETFPAQEQRGACRWNAELNSNLTTEYITSTTQPSTTATARPLSPPPYERDTATLAHGTKRRADDSSSAATTPPSSLPSTPPVQEPRCFKAPEGRGGSVSDGDDDDDDNESVEDVSISHIVPMCPPTPSPPSSTSSPAPRGRAVVVAAEETGGASGSSPDCEPGMGGKTSGLRLEGQRRTRYQGPYTLACDVTPSPMQEHVTLASTITGSGSRVSSHVTAAPTCTSTCSATSGGVSSVHSSQLKVPRRPRKLPEIPRKHQGLATASSTHVRSIFDEIQEALIKEASDEVFHPSSSSSAHEVNAAQQYPYIHKHVAHLFDKKRLLIGYASSSSGPTTRSREASQSSVVSGRSRTVSTSSVLSEAGAAASVEEEEEEEVEAQAPSSSQDVEVTHRGMHRFIPRHADEVHVGIGDPLHVIREYDDLWCEGINLRSGERGIFPAMYANDLTFLEDSDGDDEHWKFTMRFLGAVEVTSSSGDFALCQAINKVAQQGRVKAASLCTLEINQYGIRMIDKSKEGHESQKFSNFFALKNISFCGTHPNNNRYFAFITKHPRELRFACHVFHSDRSTHRARDALGNAFKRFYQEYMAFTHPTEDIWME